MSVVAESLLLTPELEVTPDVNNISEYLSGISEMPSAGQQLEALAGYTFNPYSRAKRARTELAEPLADFAAGEESSTSLSVRIEALERALENGYAAETGLADMGDNWGNIESATRWIDTQRGPKFRDGKSYRYVCMELLEHEGIDDTILFPEWSYCEIDRGGKLNDFNPVRSYVFLSNVQSELQSDTPSETALRFAPLLQGIHQKMTIRRELPEIPNIALTDWETASTCMEFLQDKDSYRQTFVDVLNKGDEVSRQCLVQLALLRETLRFEKHDEFPKRYAEGVDKAIKLVMSDALYGILHHASQENNTDIRLPLKSGGDGLPLKLEKDEPLELLAALHEVFRSLRLIHPYGDIAQTIKVAEGRGFSMYRFVQSQRHDGARLHKVTAYVRDRGGVTYDPRLEYGRPGKGVEASIGYVVDLSGEEAVLPEVGKHRADGDDYRVSVRLDREGVRPEDRNEDVPHDPTQQQGTLSLDVGSVLGKDTWLSTKLARFLALGNMIRAQANGDHIGLNHVTDYFTPEDGDADVFAAAANDLKNQLETKRLSVAEVAVLISGGIKVVGRLVEE